MARILERNWLFLTGGLAGGVGAAVGIGVAVGFSGMFAATAASFATATTGFTAGATVGAASGATSGFILNTSNSLLAGENFGKSLSSGLSGLITGGVFGGLTGGIAGGIEAVRTGRDFWTGEYTNHSLVQKAATIAEKNVGGKGAVAGTKKHEYATELLKKYQKRYGHRQLYFKESDYDINGKKYILDVLDKKIK